MRHTWRRARDAPADIGALEVGKQADLILVDLDHLGFTPLNDIRKAARLLRQRQRRGA